jgi:Domain of unknown function (DUF4262)
VTGDPEAGGTAPLSTGVRPDVLTRGWAVAGGDAGDAGPAWRYTVGLHHRYQHPEVVVFGLAPETLHAILEAVVRHVRAGHRFEAGERYDAILAHYACAFEAVDRRWLPQYLAEAVAFYRAGRFPVLQCLWPDRTGRYPSDRRCDPAVRAIQWCLFPNAAGTPPGGRHPQRVRAAPPPASPR